MTTTPTRRSTAGSSVILLCTLVLGALLSTPARAQVFPSHTVRIVTFVPNGSAADAVLRLMATEVARSTGAEVVVENRPGASGGLAVAAVKQAPPDGHTLLLGGSSVMLSTLLRADGQEPFAGFTPVAQVIATPTALAVRSDLGAKTVEDYVKLARAKPGTVSYASAGVGSFAHVMMELLAKRAGVQLLHVPYPVLGNAINDTVGGRLDGVFSLIGSMQPQVTAGKMTFIGVTGDRRTSAAPDLPTFVEAGYPDLGVIAWNGLFAPAGTPPAAVEKLAAEFSRAAKLPRIAEFAKGAGMEATASTPQEFRSLLTREKAYWVRVINETGVKAQ